MIASEDLYFMVIKVARALASLHDAVKNLPGADSAQVQEGLNESYERIREFVELMEKADKNG